MCCWKTALFAIVLFSAHAKPRELLEPFLLFGFGGLAFGTARSLAEKNRSRARLFAGQVTLGSFALFLLTLLALRAAAYNLGLLADSDRRASWIMGLIVALAMSGRVFSSALRKSKPPAKPV